MPYSALYSSTSPLSHGGGQLPTGEFNLRGIKMPTEPTGIGRDPYSDVKGILKQPFRPKSMRGIPWARVPRVVPHPTPKQAYALRKGLLLLARGARGINPYARAFDFLLGNSPFFYPYADPLGGAYSYNGPGGFRECKWAPTPDWDDGYIAPFYVDAGEVLGAPLTCLSEQAVFATNMPEGPSERRNVWLMRFHWKVRPEVLPPGLGRSSSVWVRHIPAGLMNPPLPYPLPMPEAGPAPAPSPFGSEQPWNPFDPDAGSPLEFPPDPDPLPWKDAAHNKPRPWNSGGDYGPPNSPIKPKYREGGVRKGPQKPGRREKEKKIDAQGGKFLTGLVVAGSKILGGITELQDALDAFWKALPADIRRLYGSSFLSKIDAVYDHWDKINYKVALVNLAVNHLEDKAIGRFMQMGPEGQKIARKNGYWSSDLTLTKRWNPPSTYVNL